MSARDTALAVLIACRRQDAWSDGAMKRRIAADRLDRRDAALAARLCYGVLQNRLLLDYWIGLFLKTKQKDLHPAVPDILRLAVYQLRFMDKVPASAAVNEAVEQTKRLVNSRAAGLVNGVLRNMLRQPELLTLPEDLSIRYSHPRALVDLLRQNVGEDRLEPLLQAHNSVPPVYLQINTLRADADGVLAALEGEGLTAAPHAWLPDCLELRGGSVEQIAVWQEGKVYVQDPAARLAVLATNLQPDMRVLDCCAAPGGKSFAAAICMENRGELISCDIHPHKIELIEKSAARLGLSGVRACVKDASEYDPAWDGGFDAVIADVPCSGLGVIRKKPDIRYKDLTQLAGLPAVQRRILETQARYVRPGGVLLYSTCTILKLENEEQIAAFLGDHPEYRAEPFSLPGGLAAPEGMLTLLPSVHDTDGFFIAKLRRMP